MRQTGMLVVSLRGVHFGFWSHFGCSGQSANILIRPPRSRLGFREETELRKEKQKSNFLFNLFLGVKIFLSHAQIGLL